MTRHYHLLLLEDPNQEKEKEKKKFRHVTVVDDFNQRRKDVASAGAEG